MNAPRPPLTLMLLQARKVVMAFFRPSLNHHNLTGQHWRIMRILREHGEMEIYQLAQQACILKPSMTGVLGRMERDGLIRRWRPEYDQRRVLVCLSERGHQRFVKVSSDMALNYQQILEQFGEENLQHLLDLLHDLKQIQP